MDLNGGLYIWLIKIMSVGGSILIVFIFLIKYYLLKE